MKLEDQRISSEYSSDSMDPEFLTFRHNSPNLIEPSGRSIFSQRVQYLPEIGTSYYSYKSLDKYPFNAQNRSQRQEPQPNLFKKNNKYREDKRIMDESPPIKKQNYLRNYRSIQKYDEHEPIITKSYHESKREAKKKCITHNQEEAIAEQAEELKKELTRLVKNIKREQRRQIYFQKQVMELNAEIEELDDRLAEQDESVEELSEINEDNKGQCENISQNLRKVQKNNEELSIFLNELDDEMDSSEVSVETIKQDSVKDRALSAKLKKQIIYLNETKAELDERVKQLSREVEYMYKCIQENDRLEIQIHNSLYK